MGISGNCVQKREENLFIDTKKPLQYNRFDDCGYSVHKIKNSPSKKPKCISMLILSLTGLKLTYTYVVNYVADASSRGKMALKISKQNVR
jgi:phosphopantothenoylcysteine synthetase/decarboxylase